MIMIIKTKKIFHEEEYITDPKEVKNIIKRSIEHLGEIKVIRNFVFPLIGFISLIIFVVIIGLSFIL